MADGTSERTQRRNAQRARTMTGHPSSLPSGGEGQLFGTDPFTRPPRGTPIPSGPQPKAEQQQLPFKGTISVPGEQPSAFAAKGIGKYVNRNANGFQFNKPAIHKAVSGAIEAYDDAKYFSHAGMGAALRHTLGMSQLPSHRSDDINTRRRQAVMQGQNTAGSNPGYAQGQIEHEPPEMGESALSFDERHGRHVDMSW